MFEAYLDHLLLLTPVKNVVMNLLDLALDVNMYMLKNLRSSAVLACEIG
jgi:hypothetical protein